MNQNKSTVSFEFTVVVKLSVTVIHTSIKGKITPGFLDKGPVECLESKDGNNRQNVISYVALESDFDLFSFP